MKRRSFLPPALFLLCSLLVIAAAAGGDASDPLVSLSHLQGAFTKTVESRLDSALTASDAALKAHADSGTPKGKAFACGTLSGVAEPVGAILTILVTSLVTPVLPYILAFAAGAMIYVVIEELIPESRSDEHSNVGTVGAALGFALMMLLDVALG